MFLFFVLFLLCFDKFRDSKVEINFVQQLITILLSSRLYINEKKNVWQIFFIFIEGCNNCVVRCVVFCNSHNKYIYARLLEVCAQISSMG